MKKLGRQVHGSVVKRHIEFVRKQRFFKRTFLSRTIHVTVMKIIIQIKSATILRGYRTINSARLTSMPIMP